MLWKLHGLANGLHMGLPCVQEVAYKPWQPMDHLPLSKDDVVPLSDLLERRKRRLTT